MRRARGERTDAEYTGNRQAQGTVGNLAGNRVEQEFHRQWGMACNARAGHSQRAPNAQFYPFIHRLTKDASAKPSKRVLTLPQASAVTVLPARHKFVTFCDRAAK
ncbi:hypothetical protein THI4931_27300 [Pandoraea sputorum]|nr:hypothetical protein THI4931_27300 [Pandoraea sputorum]